MDLINSESALHVTMANWSAYGIYGRSLIHDSTGSYNVAKFITLQWYELPPCLERRHKGWSLAVQHDWLKGRVVFGTVYGDMHYKDLLGSIVRIGFCILVPDLYLVLHDLRCTKKHSH